MRKVLILCLLTITILLGSCSGNKVFEKYIKMEKLSWNRFNVLNFDVPVEGNSTSYDFLVAIRHIPEIPYDILPVNITFYTPFGETRSLDYSIRLKENDGKLKADCMGDLCDLVITIKDDFVFTEEGTCQVVLSNRMSKVETPGILEVGLIVKKHK
jgi:gliding motility-associated lipoprotein GldH